MTNLEASKSSHICAYPKDTYLFVSYRHEPFVVKSTLGFLGISQVLPLLFKPISALVISYHFPVGPGSALMFASSFLVF